MWRSYTFPCAVASAASKYSHPKTLLVVPPCFAYHCVNSVIVLDSVPAADCGALIGDVMPSPLPCGCMWISPALYDSCLVCVLMFCALFRGHCHNSVACVFGAFRARSVGLAWEVNLTNSMQMLLDLLVFF